MSNGPGLNVANVTLGFSPSNCAPLSNSDNFWNLCLFFGANVLAHAATIHPRTGATKTNSLRRMLLMLIAPITAGTVATHAIITFILGVKKGGLKWALFLSSKEGLGDAIPAGAVGILIPKDLAPVLAGRWKLVGDERHSLMLNHERTHPKHTSREPHIPAPDAHLEFILPPQSRLPGYKGYKFYPGSSFANELIAVVQLIYGIYQLVSQFGSEIWLMGLSSPYVCVIPYLYMSLINLIANLLMPTYSHIAILPPQHPSLSFPPCPSVPRASSAITLTPKDKTGMELHDLEEGTSKTHFLRRSTWNIGSRYATEEFEWIEHYMLLNQKLLRGPKPGPDGYTNRDRKKSMREKNPNLSFITWAQHFSWWGSHGGLRFSSSWSRESNPTREKEQELETWLRTHYPGVETSIHARPLRVYQYSRYISVLVTLLFMTLLLGILTHFRFMVGLYAGRFISLIYLPPGVLLIPFIILEFRGTSVTYYHYVDVFSSYDSL
jgi:hypothetical protein